MSEADGSDAPCGPEGRPSRVTVLSIIAVLAGLVSLAMCRGLPATNADSLLTALISTERLTVFYWGQNRLASVVPALASPVRQVRWNHLAQTAVLAASFFVLIGSFVRFHARRTRTRTTWPVLVVSTLFTGLVVLALLTTTSTYVLVLEQQYALSTVIFLGGLTALGGTSWKGHLAGVAALIVATMIIPSTILLTPLVVLTQRGARRRERWAVAGGAGLVSFVIASAASRTLAPEYPATRDYTDFSGRRLADGFGEAAGNLVGSVRPWPTLLVAAACVTILLSRRHSSVRVISATYVLCPVAAVGWVALFSANAWVETNQFAFRYFFIAYAAAMLPLAGAVTEACAWAAIRLDASRLRPAVPAPLAATVTAVVVVVGTVLVARTDIASIDAGAALADDAERHDADIVVGDYWRVWPAMFASRADGGDLLAAAPRAEVLRDEFLRRADRSGSLNAYCLGVEAPSCVNDLNLATQTPWELVSVRSTRPLVIEVTADP